MRQEVNDYLVITFGLLLYALGWTAFLLPYQISTGGLTGISAIVYYLTGIELQNTYFAVNLIYNSRHDVPGIRFIFFNSIRIKHTSAIC